MTETARVDEFAAALENKGYGSESLDNDTFARLVLTTINGTSNGDVGHLVADHGAYEALRLLLDADDDELDAANLRPTAEAQRAGLREVGLVTKTITDALRLQYVGSIELLTPEHDHWPQKVGDLRSAQPLLLWARGDTEALNNWRTTSIVGARAATGYGEHVAMEMAADLTFRGQAIVNGGAYGIEGMALRASLAGDGTPIAIMAGGLDRLYPSGHQALLERVADKGGRSAIRSDARRNASATPGQIRWRCARAGHQRRQRRMPPADQGRHRQGRHRRHRHPSSRH